MSAVVRLTAKSRPSVSTAMCRMRPTIFLPAYRCLDRLAVNDPRRGTSLAPGPLPVDHRRHVVDGAEQERPHETSEAPVDRSPLPANPSSAGAPRLEGRGNNGASAAHSVSVMSPGYRLVVFSMARMRPRVAVFHIRSLNQATQPRSSLFQTAFN